jgi:hypothetical protein
MEASYDSKLYRDTLYEGKIKEEKCEARVVARRTNMP